jgi:hypothetical protein
MDGTGKCKLPSTPPSTGLRRAVDAKGNLQIETLKSKVKKYPCNAFVNKKYKKRGKCETIRFK